MTTKRTTIGLVMASVLALGVGFLVLDRRPSRPSEAAAPRRELPGTTPPVVADVSTAETVRTAEVAKTPAVFEGAELEAELELEPELVTGTLRVELADGSGVPVGPGRVELHGRSEAFGVREVHTLEVPVRGWATVELEVGRWRATVEEGSLPPGFRVPLRQGQVWPEAAPPGFFARDVEVSPDTEVTVTLTCFANAEVRGRVVRRDGGRLEGAIVQLRRAEEVIGALLSGECDVDGAFVVESVPPGAYELRAYSPEDEEPLRASHAVPVEVPEGARVDVGDVRLDSAGATLVGSLLDLEGEAFADLPVAVYPVGGRWTEGVSSGRSDAAGGFRCEGVPPGTWNLTVTDLPFELARWMQPIEVHVPTGEGVVALEPLRLERTRPWYLTVVVRVASEWGESALRVELEHELPAEAPVVGAGPIRLTRAEPRSLGAAPGSVLDPSSPRDVTYRWRTKTSRGRVRVEARVGDAVRERWLELVPDGSADVLLDLSDVVPPRERSDGSDR